MSAEMETLAGQAETTAREVLASVVGRGTKVHHALTTNTLVGHPGAVSVWQALEAMEKYALLRARPTTTGEAGL